MKKEKALWGRILPLLLCLCLVLSMLPAMKLTASAAGTTDYAIGDIVEFAGYDWYIIGTESDGVKAPSGCYTLFAKNNGFGDTAFGNSIDYKDSTLQQKMEEIANDTLSAYKNSIVARTTLDGISGESPTDQLLWPLSKGEVEILDSSMQKFGSNYLTRTGEVATYTGGVISVVYYVNVNQTVPFVNSVKFDTANGSIRPALYVKAEALPEKVEGIQVAFGGQWWYVVGQGEKGSVPGPENTVTLFENPREAMGAQVILAQTNSLNYLGSDLQQKMADFSSNLNLAGKESSLIVPRTLTSADGINGPTAFDQPFWPLSKDEADRTDVEILKSELYDDVTFARFYWLRTTCDTTSWTTVYAVQGDTGDVTSDFASYNHGVRPAFYLDISNAFYLAKDAKRVTIGGNPYPLALEDFEEYKYTIFDDSLKLSMTADPAQAAQTGETLSFGYVANTGENQYLSCVLTPDGTTDVRYYNKLVKLSDTAAASGTVNIPLTGVSNGNYTLRLYTEQENNRSTDFASRTVNVKITVKDGVASIRDLGNLQLVGESGGQDGREVELRNNGTHIQWRYAGEDDNAWRDLVALDAITGGSGADGADGREVELRVEGGCVQWRYTTGSDTAWKNLISLSDLKGQDGADGREVELKNDGTAILWRYAGEGDEAWRPLVALEDITGADGKQVELRVEGGYIQWRYTGGQWQNLIALSVLQGMKGDKGDPGDTPYIGNNGNWWIGGTDTGIPATGDKGENGLTPYIGTNGNWWIGETDTGIPATGDKGEDGLTPYIGTNGNWWIGETDTGIPATGDKGENGLTPYIGTNGNWWIGNVDTGIPATGDKGETGQTGANGLTPYIGTNGNWWIGSTDTGIRAAGQNGKGGADGKDGQDGKDGADGKDGLDGIGIADLVINENGELVVTLTDGTVKNLGKVTGSDGVGVAKMEINSKGELLVTLTDGTQLNAGPIPMGESSQTLVYVSLGVGGVSLAGLLGVLAVLLKRRK